MKGIIILIVLPFFGFTQEADLSVPSKDKTIGFNIGVIGHQINYFPLVENNRSLKTPALFLELNYGVELSNHLKFTAEISTASIQVDEGYYIEQFELNNSGTSTSNRIIKNDPVRTTQLLVGLKPSIGRKTKFYLGAQIGLGLITYGEVKLENQTHFLMDESKKSFSGFAYQLSVGSDIPINKSFMLNADFGYLKTNRDRTDSSRKTLYQILNASLGVAYQF